MIAIYHFRIPGTRSRGIVGVTGCVTIVSIFIRNKLLVTREKESTAAADHHPDLCVRGEGTRVCSGLGSSGAAAASVPGTCFADF
jgi:hypothetical protein